MTPRSSIHCSLAFSGWDSHSHWSCGTATLLGVVSANVCASSLSLILWLPLFLQSPSNRSWNSLLATPNASIAGCPRSAFFEVHVQHICLMMFCYISTVAFHGTSHKHAGLSGLAHLEVLSPEPEVHTFPSGTHFQNIRSCVDFKLILVYGYGSCPSTSCGYCITLKNGFSLVLHITLKCFEVSFFVTLVSLH